MLALVNTPNGKAPVELRQIRRQPAESLRVHQECVADPIKADDEISDEI